MRIPTVTARPGGADKPRGAALYEKLVAIACDHGVITPEDHYLKFPHPSHDDPMLIQRREIRMRWGSSQITSLIAIFVPRRPHQALAARLQRDAN